MRCNPLLPTGKRGFRDSGKRDHQALWVLAPTSGKKIAKSFEKIVRRAASQDIFTSENGLPPPIRKILRILLTPTPVLIV